jgi:hypothetical protein
MRLERATQDVLDMLHAAAFAVKLAARAFLSSRKRAGLLSTDDVALRRASSSCLSITPAACLGRVGSVKSGAQIYK